MYIFRSELRMTLDSMAELARFCATLQGALLPKNVQEWARLLEEEK